MIQLRAFAHRNFTLYWLGQAVSLFGTWMQIVALNWLAYQLTDSPLALGVINFITLLPAGLVMVAGGAVSDRFPPRALMLGLESVLAVVALGAAGLAWQGHITIWHVAFVTFVVVAANSLETSARAVLVMQVVGPEDFQNAVGLNAALLNVARLVGPAVAGVLIAINIPARPFGGEAICFAINAVSYIATITALVAMRLPPRTTTARPASLGRSIAAGAKYTWKTTPIRMLLLLIAVPSFLGQPLSAFMPVIARELLQTSSVGYGFMISAVGAGSAAGALVGGSIANDRRRASLMIAGLAFPGCLVLVALSRSLPLTLIFLAGAAISQAIQNVIIYSTLQLVALAEYRGRVASLYSVVTNGLARAGGVPFGMAAQVGGIGTALFLGGALCLGTMAALLPGVTSKVFAK